MSEAGERLEELVKLALHHASTQAEIQSQAKLVSWMFLDHILLG